MWNSNSTHRRIRSKSILIRSHQTRQTTWTFNNSSRITNRNWIKQSARKIKTSLWRTYWLISRWSLCIRHRKHSTLNQPRRHHWWVNRAYSAPSSLHNLASSEYLLMRTCSLYRAAQHSCNSNRTMPCRMRCKRGRAVRNKRKVQHWVISWRKEARSKLWLRPLKGATTISRRVNRWTIRQSSRECQIRNSRWHR